MKFALSLLSLILFVNNSSAQTYPIFGDEINVSITGLTYDAMEPFISHDGNTLYFNNLNDGVNTKLFYASKINDSTFNYVGELNGTGQPTPPYLDAVADLDSIGNIYWTSTRNYGPELDNLFHGKINRANVTNIGRVRGDFNKNIPGWLVMDHGMSLDGELLYFNNARLDENNCQGPCETEIGVAQKINDSTFNTLANSSSIFQTINDNNFKFYAPCISPDNLEFYYTRYSNVTLQPSTLFEICVAVRNSPTGNFSQPKVLFSKTIGSLIEAPTLTTDGRIMYYHEKTNTSHKIMMRYRNITTFTPVIEATEYQFTVYPIPASAFLKISFHETKTSSKRITLTDMQGKIITLIEQTNLKEIKIDLNNISTGIYLLNSISADGIMTSQKVVIE
jgi:hypothetical protein